MGHLCDFCGEQRSIVYCRSDAACLCLSCDRNVHSANALSRRHSRTLLCERCNSQPASVRCAEENMSLCQNCDWNGHGGSTSSSAHKRQSINCYSGCPSASELSRIWSFVLDFTSMDDPNCERGMGLMSIDENSVSNCWGPSEMNNKVDVAVSSGNNDMENMEKFDMWMESSSMPTLNAMQCGVDQPAGSLDSTAPKLSSPGTKGLELCEDDLYEDFSVADVDLNFENYDELFGVSQSHSEHLFENGGIDSLFGMKDITGADSNCQGSSGGKVTAKQPACSSAVSGDSTMSTKTEPIISYAARQANSSRSLSFSGFTGESSAGDYQDCGVSSMLGMGEPPWYPPGTEGSFTSAGRDSAVLRYREKKKARKFDKKIRYASRKARADVRRRVKGRFVKAGDAYDYDPLCQTRSY
ncbi:zinc finger protein [Macleaya cordata]|uniref:Zinc finger protein n=1 Tax=Macleaya cordata TaxID=56857 RepID=A0A200RAK1_MACCD|nr:zinc finger protein [Macleaya cordata]